MLTITSFQPLYGKLSDIFGRKYPLLFAYAVFGTGCLFCGLARNMNELIVARVSGHKDCSTTIQRVTNWIAGVQRHWRWGHDDSCVNITFRYRPTSGEGKVAGLS